MTQPQAQTQEPQAQKTQTAQQVATKTVSKLLGSTARQPLSRTTVSLHPLFHLGAFGAGKSGKTHLGLGARTHAVYAAETDPRTFEVQKGELLIPSRPLTVAYANFDRDADTVLINLPEDFSIIEEKLYLDGQGEDAQIMVFPTEGELDRLMDRFAQFLADVEADVKNGVVHLCQVDGGTPLWDNIRDTMLNAVKPAGKTPEGEPRHLARQYGPPNNKIRSVVMQRLYSMPCHTYLTLESRDRWTGQNDKALDAQKNVIQDPDGWSKTEYYVDMFTEMKIRESINPLTGSAQKERVAIPVRSVSVGSIGATYRAPTYAGLYRAAFSRPLLVPDDYAAYDELEATHAQLFFE